MTVLATLFRDLRVRINPGFSKIYYEPFGFRSGFEPIRQPLNSVRVPLAIYLPSDFCARTPEFGALLKRGIRDDQSIVIKQICHACDYRYEATHGWQFFARASFDLDRSYVKFAIISSSLAARSTGLPNGWGQSIPVGQ
jgi:hypothetical protein